MQGYKRKRLRLRNDPRLPHGHNCFNSSVAAYDIYDWRFGLKILDLSAGKPPPRYPRKHPLVTFLDRREEVNPDIVCDTRSLPDYVGKDFDLIVFDPPHENLGANSRMAKSYGHSTREDIKDTVIKSCLEAHRVSRENALMAFKWNDCGWKLETVLSWIQKWEPLFAHGLSIPGRHKSQTYWVMFRRLP